MKDDNPVSWWRKKRQESHGSEKGVAFGFEFCLTFHWIGRQEKKKTVLASTRQVKKQSNTLIKKIKSSILVSYMYAAIITLSWRKPRNAAQQEEEEILRACLRRTEGIQQKQETKKPIRSRSTPSNLKESWQRDDVLAFSQSFPWITRSNRRSKENPARRNQIQRKKH
jgi:hypothetical protein